MNVLIGANPMGLEKAIPELQEKYPNLTFTHCADRAETAAYIDDADIYMGWLSQEAFLAAQQLKWVQSPSTGINYFLNIQELRESDVLLTSASGTHSNCLAESTFGMILAFTRGIRHAIFEQQKKHYAMWEVRANLVELTDSTIGVVGYGAFGRAVAKRAKAFDMRVAAVDIYPNNPGEYADELWGLDQLDRLLEESDYVVVTVPHTPDTEGMIGAAEMAKMKSSAILLAMSRGGIVDQDALVDALKSKQIAAAALDVFKPEPLPAESELWEMENVLITPHIAGGTQYEGKYLIDIFTQNLDKFLSNDLPLHNQVDMKQGF